MSAIECNLEKEYYKKMKKNIVLIGMPSCGKTTIGKILAKEWQRPFFDSDEEIIKQEHCSIPELFKEKGEVYFRKVEAKIIEQLSQKEACIISTGGGVILNKKNMECLQKNGWILFIDRPLSQLVSQDENRPLLKNKHSIQQLYKERYDLYVHFAHKIIQNNGRIEDTLDAVRRYDHDFNNF